MKKFKRIYEKEERFTPQEAENYIGVVMFFISFMSIMIFSITSEFYYGLLLLIPISFIPFIILRLQYKCVKYYVEIKNE